MIRTYFKFKELCNVNYEGWESLFYDWLREYVDDEYTAKLYDYLFNEFADEYIFYADACVGLTVADLQNNPELKTEVKATMRKIRTWLDLSKDKYETLIQLYKNHEQSLMKRVESTVQFNDTPQSTTQGLDGDQYASTYTKNASDGATVIQRLAEIRALWENLYEDWVNEFRKKFVL